MKKLLKNSAISAFALLFIMAFSPLANAAENPFGMSNVATDMQVASNHADGKCGDSKKKGKCGEGKCGDSMKMDKKSGKCGEGKCGDSMKKDKMSGKCGDSMKKGMSGEGKCGDSMKKGMKEEGKCGANHKKKNNGKCGGN